MANVLNVVPYKVDTASPSSAKTQGALPASQPFILKEIYWLNPITSGDTFVMTDQSGAVIRAGRCENGNQSQLFQLIPPVMVLDFTVSTLASGTLYIR